MGNREKMPVSHRAKQFMPFSALTGLNEALKKKEKELCFIAKPVISEEKAELINAELLNIDPGDKVCVEYYKDGEIHTVVGTVKKKDLTYHRIVVGAERIRTDDILNIYRDKIS